MEEIKRLVPVDALRASMTPAEDDFWRAVYLAYLLRHDGNESCGAADKAVLRRRERIAQGPYR